jgi:hypothetical protein
MINQLTREEALEELKNEPYELDKQERDKEYVAKKWDYTIDEFNEIMNQPSVPHKFYGEGDEKASWYLRLLKYFQLVYLYKFAYPLGLDKPEIR